MHEKQLTRCCPGSLYTVQVKQVLKVGQEVSGFGRNLTGLFKQAITAGKRVRTETNISAGAVSVSSAAVELAVMKLPVGGVSRVNVLIVGAGKMSKLLVKHLISKGCTRMVIVNRSEQRVLDLQTEFPDAKIVYEQLGEMLRCAGEADLVFTSTSSEVPLFMKENVEPLAPASQVAHVNTISIRHICSNPLTSCEEKAHLSVGSSCTVK